MGKESLMAKESNYSRYMCDRCGKVEFLKPDTPQTNNWISFTRVTATGASSGYLFDRDCYEQYKTVGSQWDQAFNDFLANKTTQGAE